MNQPEEVTEEKKYECPICKVDGNIKHDDFFSLLKRLVKNFLATDKKKDRRRT